MDGWAWFIRMTRAQALTQTTLETLGRASKDFTIESHPSSNKDAQNFIARTMHEIIVITKDNRFHSLKDDLIYQIKHLSPFIL